MSDRCIDIAILKSIENFACKIEKFFCDAIKRLYIMLHDAAEVIPELWVVIMIVKQFDKSLD